LANVKSRQIVCYARSWRTDCLADKSSAGEGSMLSTGVPVNARPIPPPMISVGTNKGGASKKTMLDSKPVRIHAEQHSKLTAIANENGYKLITLLDIAIAYFIKHRHKVLKPAKNAAPSQHHEANK
jgi:hypothetical protein